MSVPKRVPTLTILVHPDLSRIGERALLVELLQGNAAELGRNTPDFAPPGHHFGTPLEDVFLSRVPARVLPSASGVELRLDSSRSAIYVDGEEAPIAASRHIPMAVLESGVTIALADRVLLLLHLVRDAASTRRDRDHGLVGEHHTIDDVRSAIDRVADLDVTVLLRGESGTGKELVARAIHEAGARSPEPFVAVNLGALPPALAAAEIFGSAKGAFTGAVAAQRGYLRAAGRGTLFLDEVGEAPPEIQAMLLRALESREFFPVGSRRAERLEARLVAATDSDLERRVRDGDFKEPLLHRLASYEIILPPLRDRREDIARLFHHFAAEERERLGSSVLPGADDPDAPPWCPVALMSRWLREPWPGNVRQLRNRVRQTVIDSRYEPQLRIIAHPADSVAATTDEPSSEVGSAAVRRPHEITDDELLEAMRASRFEPAAAARRLGISRPSVYNRIRAHPTLRTAEDVPEDEMKHTLETVGGDIGAAAQTLEVSARGLRRRLSLT